MSNIKSNRMKRFFIPVVLVSMVAGIATIGYNLITGDHTEAATNSKCAIKGPDIMPRSGGQDAISSPSDFVNKIRSNWENCGDYQQIYNHYGLKANDHNRFVSESKAGILRDGKIYVNGILVAKDIKNVSRRSAGNAKQVNIGNTSYYEHDAKALKGDRPVTVLFDKEGRVQFSLLNICANPEPGTPVHPTYGCKALNATRNNHNTYTFNTDVSIINPEGSTNTAKVTRVVYSFGDGTTVTKTNPSEKVTKTFSQSGSHKVRVTVYVKTTFGTEEVALNSASCETTVTTKDADKPKITIDKLVNGKEHDVVGINQEFTYSVKVANTGNVALKNVKVTDKAPTHVEFINTDKGSIENGVLTYNIANLAVNGSETITLKAKVTKVVSGLIKNTATVDTPQIPGSPDDEDDATVELLVRVCNTKTGVIETIKSSQADQDPYTKDLTRCDKIKVCDLKAKRIVEVSKKDAENTNLYGPAEHEACKEPINPTAPSTPETPAELPKTGTVTGVLGIGALVTAGLAYISSRRNLG